MVSFKLTGPRPSCCTDNNPTINRVWEYSEVRLTLHTPQDPTHRRSQRVQTPHHKHGLRAPPSPLSWPPAAWSLRGERCSVSADRYLHSPFSRWGLTHAKLGDYTEVIFEEMRSAVGVHICNCSWRGRRVKNLRAAGLYSENLCQIQNQNSRPCQGTETALNYPSGPCVCTVTKHLGSMSQAGA